MKTRNRMYNEQDKRKPSIKSKIVMSVAAVIFSGQLYADMGAAKKWVDSEFQPSTLTKDQQMKEMEWFAKAAEPFKGMEIKVLSETIPTHVYESKTLAAAFTEITGIKVTHEMLQEGDVVRNLEKQMYTGENLYDAYINDSDLIGTHARYGQVVNLTDYMAGDGKDVTLPTLDLEDFIGLDFTTGMDGKLYQLPDQQFANLYWFRYDWFQRDDIKQKFKEAYGYDLGVPVNWSAYEDIAEFFSKKLGEVDGVKVYGHMDYGKKDPSLGWRFTDAWLSMAGAGDKGLPNGNPVDEWGIRVEGCHPVGSSVDRGGAVNGPAAVYSLEKYIKWMNEYAAPGASEMNFSEAGAVPKNGNVAQQMFFYTLFTEAMTEKGLPVVNEDGTPKWRVAPSPKGAYWEQGMKLGYQDVGSWTLLQSTPDERRKAAWLYAQFVVSKTVSLKKTVIGYTPIRDSDIQSDAMTELAPRLGGLVEFYRGEARKQWTPTGNNVPDYPKLAPLWWQNIGDATSGKKTAQEALDSLAKDQDKILREIEKSGIQKTCAPKMAKRKDLKGAEYWLAQPGAPKAKLENEKPAPITISYEELLNSWK